MNNIIFLFNFYNLFILVVSLFLIIINNTAIQKIMTNLNLFV